MSSHHHPADLPATLTIDATFDLPDGRTLGWAEYGDPVGFPVLYNHGGLSCRLDVASAGADAAAAGLRIIAPDRPGVATSTRLEDRDLAAWPADVVALAEHLGLERFGVLGWSFGGAYALALGHALADRVPAVVLLASVLPLDDVDGLPPLNKMDLRFLELAKEHPGRARTMFLATHELADHAPGLFGRFSVKDLAPGDQAVLVDDEERRFTQAYADATADTDGMVDEYRVFNQPWGFGPADVTVPTHVWQGTADNLVPREWGEALAERLPDATLHLVDDAGHFVGHGRWADVLAPFTG